MGQAVFVLLFRLKEKYFNNLHSFPGSYVIYLFWKTTLPVTGCTDTELPSSSSFISFLPSLFSYDDLLRETRNPIVVYLFPSPQNSVEFFGILRGFLLTLLDFYFFCFALHSYSNSLA